MERTETGRKPETATMAEACERLGVSVDLGYDLARRGDFPAKVIKLGGRWVVVRRSLDRVLDGQEP